MFYFPIHSVAGRIEWRSLCLCSANEAPRWAHWGCPEAAARTDPHNKAERPSKPTCSGYVFKVLARVIGLVICHRRRILRQHGAGYFHLARKQFDWNKVPACRLLRPCSSLDQQREQIWRQHCWPHRREAQADNLRISIQSKFEHKIATYLYMLLLCLSFNFFVHCFLTASCLFMYLTSFYICMSMYIRTKSFGFKMCLVKFTCLYLCRFFVSIARLFISMYRCASCVLS